MQTLYANARVRLAFKEARFYVFTAHDCGSDYAFCSDQVVCLNAAERALYETQLHSQNYHELVAAKPPVAQYVCPINGVVHTCTNDADHPFVRANGTICTFSGAVVSRNMVSSNWKDMDTGAGDDGEDHYLENTGEASASKQSKSYLFQQIELLCASGGTQTKTAQRGRPKKPGAAGGANSKPAVSAEVSPPTDKLQSKKRKQASESLPYQRRVASGATAPLTASVPAASRAVQLNERLSNQRTQMYKSSLRIAAVAAQPQSLAESLSVTASPSEFANCHAQELVVANAAGHLTLANFDFSTTTVKAVIEWALLNNALNAGMAKVANFEASDIEAFVETTATVPPSIIYECKPTQVLSGLPEWNAGVWRLLLVPRGHFLRQFWYSHTDPLFSYKSRTLSSSLPPADDSISSEDLIHAEEDICRVSNNKHAAYSSRMPYCTSREQKYAMQTGATLADYFWETLVLTAAKESRKKTNMFEIEDLADASNTDSVQEYLHYSKNFGQALCDFFGDHADPAHTLFPRQKFGFEQLIQPKSNSGLNVIQALQKKHAWSEPVKQTMISIVGEELRLMKLHVFKPYDYFGKLVQLAGEKPARAILRFLALTFAHVLKFGELPKIFGTLAAKRAKSQLVGFSHLLHQLFVSNDRQFVTSAIEAQIDWWIQANFVHPVWVRQFLADLTI